MFFYGIILLNRLRRDRSVRAVKLVLFILPVGFALLILVLASLLAFVSELVLLCVLQLLVKLADLRFCTLALAAFLMKIGFYLCYASLQFGKLFQYIVVDALKLLDSQFHGTLVKVEFVDLVHQIMDISVFLICRHIFAIVDYLARERLPRKKFMFLTDDMLKRFHSDLPDFQLQIY